MRWATLLMLPALVSVAAACGGAPAIEIRSPVVAMPAGPVTAAYFEVVNNGDTADRIVGVRSEIGRAEIHRSFYDGELMHMEPVSELPVAGGGVAVFQPGGLHVMLSDLGDLDIGQTVTVTLVFEVAGPIDFEALVTTYAEIAP
ncbi:MAG TPA: copper chaperone PCu(A)C [Acidimicrobiia bacterium]|nr:copper chaperone PCu(A)C [Acidimicrobiia bacterium]